MFGEMVGMAWGLVALQSLLTIKKGTNPFNFQSNELFLNFLKQIIVILKFQAYVFRENTTCGGGVSTL